MKKTLAALTMLLVLLLMVSVAGAETVWTANWGYEINRDGTATINGYYGHESVSTNVKTVTVPSHLAGVPVTGIDLAIRSDVITKIILPDTLRHIGPKAFTSVKNLQEIVLCEGLETIGSEAFAGLEKLKSIRIPSTIRQVSADAFNGCAALPEGFTDALPLQEKRVENWTQVVQDNVIYRLYDGYAAAWGAEKQGSLKGKIVIAAEAEGLPVTKVGNFAFENAITQITIPEGVAEICDNTFTNCKKLKSVVLPSTLKHIGDRAFANTPLTQVTLPEGLEVIGERAFEDCKKLSKLNLPESVWQIGSSAFADTAITSIAFPTQITHLPYGVCSECPKLKKVELHEGIVAIGRFAFGQTPSLKSVTLPEGVKVIGHNAFQDSGISKITIPDKVEEIGKGAFAGKKLKQATVRTRTAKIIMSAFPRSVKNGACWKGTVAERVLKSQKVKVKYLKK